MQTPRFDDEENDFTQVLSRLDATVVRFTRQFHAVVVHRIAFASVLPFDNQIPNETNDDNTDEEKNGDHDENRTQVETGRHRKTLH